MTREEAKGYGVYSVRGDALSDRMVQVFKPKAYYHVIDKLCDETDKWRKEALLLEKTLDEIRSRTCESCKPTRVEVIGQLGRDFNKWLKGAYYDIRIQDEGRTIKLFEISTKE